MLEIQLAAVPNQSFSFTVDENQYDFTIKETNGCMAVTIERDNVLLLSNMRVVCDEPLIPYRYLEDGNFVITCLNDEMPYYTEFGKTQTLLYLSAVELEAIRG